MACRAAHDHRPSGGGADGGARTRADPGEGPRSKSAQVTHLGAGGLNFGL